MLTVKLFGITEGMSQKVWTQSPEKKEMGYCGSITWQCHGTVLQREERQVDHTHMQLREIFGAKRRMLLSPKQYKLHNARTIFILVIEWARDLAEVAALQAKKIFYLDVVDFLTQKPCEGK